MSASSTHRTNCHRSFKSMDSKIKSMSQLTASFHNYWFQKLKLSVSKMGGGGACLGEHENSQIEDCLLLNLQWH